MYKYTSIYRHALPINGGYILRNVISNFIVVRRPERALTPTLGGIAHYTPRLYGVAIAL